MVTCWTLPWSCCEILGKVSPGFHLSQQLKQFQLAMNTFLPNGLQYQINFPGGRNPSATNTLAQVALNPFQIPPHILHTQFHEFHKTFPIGLLQQQQQFFQDFTFNSSERYHSKPIAQNKNTLSTSQPDLCNTIKQEILKQLNASGSTEDSLDGNHTQEKYLSLALEESIRDEDLIEYLEGGGEDGEGMHARGTK